MLRAGVQSCSSSIRGRVGVVGGDGEECSEALRSTFLTEEIIFEALPFAFALGLGLGRCFVCLLPRFVGKVNSSEEEDDDDDDDDELKLSPSLSTDESLSSSLLTSSSVDSFLATLCFLLPVLGSAIQTDVDFVFEGVDVSGLCPYDSLYIRSAPLDDLTSVLSTWSNLTSHSRLPTARTTTPTRFDALVSWTRTPTAMLRGSFVDGMMMMIVIV